MDEDLLKMDGFDDAISGITYDIAQGVYRLVYCYESMVQILVMYHEMSEEDAEDYISYNCEGAYVGPSTPLIVRPYHGEDN